MADKMGLQFEEVPIMRRLRDRKTTGSKRDTSSFLDPFQENKRQRLEEVSDQS